MTQNKTLLMHKKKTAKAAAAAHSLVSVARKIERQKRCIIFERKNEATGRPNEREHERADRRLSEEI